MAKPLVLGAEPEMQPQIAVQTGTNQAKASVTSTNRPWAQSIEIRRRPFVLEGPLVVPLQTARKQSGAKSWAAGTKAFLNLFNPLAPISHAEPVVFSTAVEFDPFQRGWPRPFAFQDERTHEPLPLISLSK